MKSKRTKDFLFYFLINFILLIFLVLFVSQFYTENSWELFIPKDSLGDQPILTRKLPLIFYIFLFALIYSSVTFIYSNLKEKRKLKKVEDAVRMLNTGNYSAKVFLKMFSEDTPVQVNKQIDQEFLKLQERMILISEEAVSSAQQTSTISKETREEIIETERKRIARELHDSVSQQLFAAAMLLSTLQMEEEMLTERIKKQVDLVYSIINEAQSEMRALLLHLRPVQLDGKSLKIGIESLLEELESKVPVKIIHEIEEIKLTEVVENHLFRIIQELISNVLRHAEAKELEVYFKKTQDFYRLRFVDDGKGFDMEAKKNSGQGLVNIRERIERLGGNFQVVSFPNQGTSVEIRIPLITGRAI